MLPRPQTTKRPIKSSDFVTKYPKYDVCNCAVIAVQFGTLHTNADALITALVAVAAIIDVKLQLDANAQKQAAQSARDVYRAQLALEIKHPDFANPNIYTPLTFAKHSL